MITMVFACDDILKTLVEHSKALIELPASEGEGFLGTGRKGKLKGLIRGELLSLNTCIDNNNEELKHKHKLVESLVNMKPHKIHAGIQTFCENNPKRCPKVLKD